MEGQMKDIISTPHAPAAIGPYSQAVKAGHFLFVSGQLPIDPKTGKLVDGDIGKQTEQVMNNLRAICESAGASLADVVKTTLYLRDLGQFKTVNEAYGRYFTENPPARATVEVSSLPLDAALEIEATVFIP